MLFFDFEMGPQLIIDGHLLESQVLDGLLLEGTRLSPLAVSSDALHMMPALLIHVVASVGLFYILYLLILLFNFGINGRQSNPTFFRINSSQIIV